MKYLLIILSFLSLPLFGTDYYVATSGSDAATGLIGAPWATIAKVNSVWAAATFAPGDNIYFNRGDTFYGTITIAESGTDGSPITIGAYGTGANPIISGLTTITGWTNYGSGIYSKAVTCESAPEMFIFNGINTGKGRYPKTTYLIYESHSGTASITDNQLTNSPNYTGDEVVIRKASWLLDKHPITDHTNSTITYSGGDVAPRDYYGYFVQNDLSFLTSLGEWAYKSGTLYVYFGAVDPPTCEVQISTIDRCILNSGYGYVVYDGLTFEGANLRTIDLTNARSPNNTIQNCTIQYSGGIAIYGIYAHQLTVDNNLITETNSSGIYINNFYQPNFDECTIKNNIISYTGMIKGAGSVNAENYSAINVNGGIDNLIEYNRDYVTRPIE